jgi:cellulose biosynthesis protein BcsQ
MTSYAFWNNKGGVGKTFLCFVAASEYAQKHPDVDVYVIDLCPQANLSETLLGGQKTGGKELDKIISKPGRPTIAGYLEARLSSPFTLLPDISKFVTTPHATNRQIPKNLFLICGDNLVEILSEAIRQASQLLLPNDAWLKVTSWIRDLVGQLEDLSDNRDSIFFLDCNPSFSIYTQQALAAADRLVVPFTPDESSRRGLENIVVLLFGVTNAQTEAYARLSFSEKAKEHKLPLPLLSVFVSNRVTFYEGKPSRAFAAASKAIKETVDSIFSKRRSIFVDRVQKPSDAFLDIPDNHSANVVCALSGTPLSALKAGPHDVHGERVQVNLTPLNRYKSALTAFVNRL